MKNSNKYYLITISSILFFIVFSVESCGKKWKKTTTVDFQFYITSTPIVLAADDTLLFDNGKITVGEIDFSGVRKQGGQVNFSNTLQLMPVGNLKEGTVTPSIRYDIPQGVYTNISINLKAVKKDTTPCITLTGTFIDRGDDEDEPEIPVIFELGSDQIFNVTATGTSGTNDVVLVEGTPSTCKIIFDVNYWFAAVTENVFERANKSLINGDTVILINKYTNQNLYNLVTPRVSQSTKAVFQ